MNHQQSVSGALAAIEELRVDSKIGKSKHFAASDRQMIWHRVFGIPVIIANLFVGIVLVNLQSTPSRELPQTQPALSANAAPERRHQMPLLANEYLSFFSILLAFGAASLSGVQTFFNFHKASEGHRSIANRYVHVSRQCKALQQKQLDLAHAPVDLWKDYDKLYAEYSKINTEAESFPTNSADLRNARSALEISPYKNPHPSQDSSIGRTS